MVVDVIDIRKRIEKFEMTYQKRLSRNMILRHVKRRCVKISACQFLLTMTKLLQQICRNYPCLIW